MINVVTIISWYYYNNYLVYLPSRNPTFTFRKDKGDGSFSDTGTPNHCQDYVNLDSITNTLEECAANSYSDSRCGTKFSWNDAYGGECRCADASKDQNCDNNYKHCCGAQLYSFNPTREPVTSGTMTAVGKYLGDLSVFKILIISKS